MSTSIGFEWVFLRVLKLLKVCWSWGWPGHLNVASQWMSYWFYNKMQTGNLRLTWNNQTAWNNLLKIDYSITIRNTSRIQVYIDNIFYLLFCLVFFYTRNNWIEDKYFFLCIVQKWIFFRAIQLTLILPFSTFTCHFIFCFWGNQLLTMDQMSLGLKHKKIEKRNLIQWCPTN